MDIITTARHFEMTPEIRRFMRKRIEKLQRYADGIDEVHVVLSVEKYRKIAEMTLHTKGNEIVSREITDDMQQSVDRVVDRIERQIKRLRGRQRTVRRGAQARRAAAPPPPSEGAAVEVEEEAEASETDAPVEEESYPPVVVRDEEAYPEPITVERAIEILRERGGSFLLFRNARSQKVALVHEREDGNYSLIEAP
ncbi:MAG: ribosome-associated translation inhibitor RaiA [Candidatus Eisenbacteria bacterium]|nr:ribosome-associated translation inhibitor RaiA [Candidatus Eisenbacteria bacterium]